jgi:hypothetical protein
VVAGVERSSPPDTAPTTAPAAAARGSNSDAVLEESSSSDADEDDDDVDAFWSRRQWEARRRRQQRSSEQPQVVNGGDSSSTAEMVQRKKPPPPPPEVIDLLDSESDEDDNDDDVEDDDSNSERQEHGGADAAPLLPPRKHPVSAHGGDFRAPYGTQSEAQKRQRVDSQLADPHPPPGHSAAPNLAVPPPPPGRPDVLHGMPPPRPDAPLLSASTSPGPPSSHQRHVAPMPPPPLPPPQHHQQLHHRLATIGIPEYVPYPPGFRPTWTALMPDMRPPAAIAPAATAAAAARPPRRKYYKLSLLNVNQFTITGLSPEYGGPPTSIAGLRVPIRQIARDHGKAVFDKDPSSSSSGEGDSASANNVSNYSGSGRWRIPLGAYHAFYAYLVSDPNTRVDGIPPHQLQIASLERARQEKGYPSMEAIADRGVPPRLAKALAPSSEGASTLSSRRGAGP